MGKGFSLYNMAYIFKTLPFPCVPGISPRIPQKVLLCPPQPPTLPDHGQDASSHQLARYGHEEGCPPPI